LKLDGLIKSRNIVTFMASSNQNLSSELREMGVKETFKKPFSLDDLIKLIEKYRPRTQKKIGY
jgi:type IV secretory pathway ATPase VirB11/archaellum biosynthesis ATPase